MSAAHTPGPWRVFLTRDGQTVIGVGDRKGQGITDQGDVSTNDQGVWRSGREKKANAQLISAAPDGLEVASDICAILDEHCAHDGEALVYDHEAIGEEVARLHEKLTAFIAKARGEFA